MKLVAILLLVVALSVLLATFHITQVSGRPVIFLMGFLCAMPMLIAAHLLDR